MQVENQGGRHTVRKKWNKEKESQRKQIIKIKAEINVNENKDTMERINKALNFASKYISYRNSYTFVSDKKDIKDRNTLLKLR